MEEMQVEEQEARETIRQLEFDYLAFKRERSVRKWVKGFALFG